MPVPRLADSTRPDSLASRLRAQRQDLFIKEVEPQFAERILDVGGTEQAWRGLPFARRVTILNLVRTNEDRGLCPFVLADARAMPFPDRSFDLVFSNSVIEHVGNAEQQACFAREIRRVGSRYWVQAPNRYFPLEPHFLFPGFQFLPTSAKLLVGRYWPFSWLKHFGATNAQLEHEVRALRLPSAGELRRLFPDGYLYREKVLGLTKSLVLYSSRPHGPVVATLLSSPLTQGGGISTYVANLLAALERHDALRTDLIAPGRPRSEPGQRVDQMLLGIEHFLALVRRRPDAVHVHEHPVLLGSAIFYKLLANREARVIFSLHVDAVRRLSLWKRVLFGWLLGRCSAVTAVSRHAAARFSQLAATAPTCVRIVPGAARVTLRSRDDPAVRAFAGSLPLSGGPLVCQIAPLNFPLKVAGILRLLEAFVIVRAQIPNAQLLLVGDGLLRGRVERACARLGLTEAVIMTGWVEDISLPLALTDIYCHITFQDACPLSLLEAMQSGKPVVASRAGGIPELVRDRIDGILLDNVPREIARAISELLADAAGARRLGDQARARAEEHFTWERVADEFASLYLSQDNTTRQVV